MFKGIKIRIYPNKKQELYINQLLGCYRLVYNKCLSEKINTYTTDKINLGLKELGHYLRHNLSKSEKYSFLNEHNTKILNQSIICLLNSYKRFFINESGFPKFKSKKDNNQSCRFVKEAISTKNDYLTNRITLVKQLKNIKFKCSDKYKNYLEKNKLNIKSATLSKTKSGKYFLSILVDGPIDKSLLKVNNIVGIDLGIKDFIITSEGISYENIKIKKNNEKTLIKLNRQLSKKTNGSKNKNKARIKLAKFHEKLNNQKENYLHYVSNQLLNENQVIVMENLNVKGMLKNHKLSKSIQELSLGRFKIILKYKSEWYGRYLIEIDKWFPSSKLCSMCGFKNDKLTLKDREWSCPQCHTNHNRDLNAAINIKNEGERIIKIGHRLSELTLVDYPLMDDKVEIPLKSYDRMNQEIEILPKNN